MAEQEAAMDTCRSYIDGYHRDYAYKAGRWWCACGKRMGRERMSRPKTPDATPTPEDTDEPT